MDNQNLDTGFSISKNKHSKLILILISFIVVLTIFIGGLFVFTNVIDKDNKSSDGGTPTNTPVPTQAVAQCEYEGKSYREGESFDKGDSCNTCTCQGGKVSCGEQKNITKYTNSNLPNFSFEYNSCEWVLSKEDNLTSVSNGNKYEIHLSQENNHLIFDLQPIGATSWMHSCNTNPYFIINDNLTRMQFESNYIYTKGITVKGTQNFDQLLVEYPHLAETYNIDNIDWCTIDPSDFYTAYPTRSDVNIHIFPNIKLGTDENLLNEVDKIIQSMKY